MHEGFKILRCGLCGDVVEKVGVVYAMCIWGVGVSLVALVPPFASWYALHCLLYPCVLVFLDCDFVCGPFNSVDYD